MNCYYCGDQAKGCDECKVPKVPKMAYVPEAPPISIGDVITATPVPATEWVFDSGDVLTFDVGSTTAPAKEPHWKKHFVCPPWPISAAEKSTFELISEELGNLDQDLTIQVIWDPNANAGCGMYWLYSYDYSYKPRRVACQPYLSMMVKAHNDPGTVARLIFSYWAAIRADLAKKGINQIGKSP